MLFKISILSLTTGFILTFPWLYPGEKVLLSIFLIGYHYYSYTKLDRETQFTKKILVGSLSGIFLLLAALILILDQTDYKRVYDRKLSVTPWRLDYAIAETDYSDNYYSFYQFKVFKKDIEWTNQRMIEGDPLPKLHSLNAQ